MFKRPLKIIIILILVIAAVLIWVFFKDNDNSNQVNYSLEVIKSGRIKSTVSATGSLSPKITVQVGSQVSGRLKQVNVDFNSKVKKGDIIAQIDPAIFKARLAEAEADLKSAIAEHGKAQVKVFDTRRQLNRQISLRKKNLASQTTLETARFNYQSALVDLKVKLAAISKTTAIRDREKVNLNYTTILAPIDGVVISRDVDAGQTVAASLQAPTLFTIAKDLSQMQIETDVDEAFIGKVKQNQKVEFTVFAYPTRTFKGRVTQIRLKPKVESGVVKYNCIVHVDNADLALKPGMTATVNIVIASKPKTLKVSNAALRFVPPGWDNNKLLQLRRKLKPNQTYLWTITNGTYTPLKIKMGIISERQTEIFGRSVKQGMKIAVPVKRKKSSRRRRGLSVF